MSFGSKYATAPGPGSDPRRIHSVQNIGGYFPQIMSIAPGVTAPERQSVIRPARNGEVRGHGEEDRVRVVRCHR
jgi:hypothetical protein